MKAAHKILSKLLGDYRVDGSVVSYDNGTGHFELVGYRHLPVLLLSCLPEGITPALLATANEELRASGIRFRFVVTAGLFDQLLETESGYSRDRLFELPVLERDEARLEEELVDRGYLAEGYC